VLGFSRRACGAAFASHQCIPDSPLKPRWPPASAPAGGGLRPPGRAASTAALHGAVLLFGVAGLFGKWVAASALVIVFGRVLVASLAFALLLRLRPLSGLRPAGRRRLALWACGALLAFHWVTFFHAIQVSSVAVGLLAYSTAPVFVVLLEPLWFAERLSGRALACAALTMAGVALIVPRWAPGAAVFQGMAWGVAAGLSFALLSLANRALVRAHGAIRVAFHQDAAAMVLLAPLLPLAWTPLSARDVALLVALGLFCTALAHALYIQAMRVLAARVAAIASALEPVYGIALAWLLLGEAPAPRTLAGGALILAAVLWATLRPGPGALSAAP
jgi:drug/metabolite transporter (DMT)-like permease